MTIELAKAKQILVSKIGDMLVDGDLESFLSSVLSALSLKLEDAPSDGKQYSREDGTWSEVVIPTPDVTEAPVDGKQYVRQDAAWEEVSIPAQGVEEAPSDGKTYGRKDADWVEVTGGAGGGGVVRMDFFEEVEDVLDPASLPIEAGVSITFTGVAAEIIPSENFIIMGEYVSHIAFLEPTAAIVLQTIGGPLISYKRFGSVELDGETFTSAMGPWSPYSATFSDSRSQNAFIPNVEYNSATIAQLYTVSVHSATAEVTVTQGSTTLMRWTPTSISDTHTFTFSALPTQDGITVGSSGSFMISGSTRTI